MRSPARAFLREHQATFAVLAAFVCVTIATIEFASGLARSNRSWRDVERELCGLVAEDAAFAACGDVRPGLLDTTARWPHYEVLSRRDPGEVHVTVTSGTGRTYDYTALMLPGAAPALLGTETGVGMPPLAAAVTEGPPLGADASLLVREDSLGLLRIRTGTDAADWSLRADPDGVVRPRLGAPATARIEGNLWFDRGPRPAVVELDHSWTLVVRGNVYLGRSLQVRGNGRLTLVAIAAPGLRYHDRDGDGVHSPGDGEIDDRGAVPQPVEGSANVYLGLPGQGGEAPSLECQAALWAAGDLVVVDTAVRARAPMLRGLETLLVGSGARITTDLAAPLACEREWVPGFEPRGGPRPGRLVRRGEREKALPSPSPGR